VASTAHCATHRAQYPKDHAQDEQDGADRPKDADVEQRSEDKQDNAKDDQGVPPVVGVFVTPLNGPIAAMSGPMSTTRFF
jgi:hypothetical protein